MNNSITEKRYRYNLIDAIRGFLIICVVIFHFLYDVFEIYGMNRGWSSKIFTEIVGEIGRGCFVLISGMCLNFSNHPYKRGIVLNLCGILITVVTFCFSKENTVWFGILSLLGCAMIITEFFRKYLDRVEPLFGCIFSFILFSLTYGVSDGFLGLFGLKIIALPHILYTSKFMFFTGFCRDDFYSSDYFPILPWIFLFIFGYFLWKEIKNLKAEHIFVRKIPLLSTAGRHSFFIYILHQPIIIFICMLLFS